jgi:hypothetical protein
MAIPALKCHGMVTPTKVEMCPVRTHRGFSRNEPCHDTSVSGSRYLQAPITVLVGVVGIISTRLRLTAGRVLDHAGGRGTGG